MGLGIPDECPKCGGDVQLGQGFGDTLPFTCTDCEHNFSNTSER